MIAKMSSEVYYAFLKNKSFSKLRSFSVVPHGHSLFLLNFTLSYQFIRLKPLFTHTSKIT